MGVPPTRLRGRVARDHTTFLVAASAVSAAAETATATASGAASASSSATTASAAGAASTVTTSVAAAVGATISAAFRASVCAAAAGYRGVAVEVGFVVGEIGAAFDRQCGSVRGFAAASLRHRYRAEVRRRPSWRAVL